MTPQQAQAQLERAKGSALTPDELSTAQQMLTSSGWTQGGDISDQQFQSLLQRGRSAWTPSNPQIATGGGPSPSPTGNYTPIGNGPNGEKLFRGPDGKTYAQGFEGYTPWTGASPGTNGGGNGNGGTGNFTPGSLAPPAYPALPMLNTQGFQAPTMAEALNDQGYQTTVAEGQRRLEGSAAARGLLRTGGTLKDLIDYGQNAGTTQYNNVFNRNLNAWEANNQNTNTQYGLNTTRQNNIYAPQIAGWQTGITQANTNADRQNALTQQNYSNQWNQYLQQFLQSQWNQQFPFTVLNTLAGRGAT